MGRHTATNGTGVDPIVAAALLRRPPTGDAGTPRHSSDHPVLAAADGDGGLGWPGEPADGTGLGWPADLRSAPADEAADGPGLTEEPASPRRGWRRLFGSTAA